MIELTTTEVRELARHTEPLRLLIEFYENDASMAEACGVNEVVAHHTKRQAELQAEVERIEGERGHR
jgi:hypothetical protein